jgi:hypothetical protein
METKATYKRDRAPKGKKVTCPVCLRKIKAAAGGSLVRHGWKEEGRRVGEYGRGYQWGVCRGWHGAPLEQTDADALKAIEGLKRSAEKARAAIETHRRGLDKYSHTVDKEVFTGNEDRDKMLVEYATRVFVGCEAETIKIRKQGHRVYYRPGLRFSFIVPRGSPDFHVRETDIKGEPRCSWKTHPLLVRPSWEALRAKHEGAARHYIKSVALSIERIRDAIAHHKANPAPWTVEASGASLSV